MSSEMQKAVGGISFAAQEPNTDLQIGDLKWEHRGTNPVRQAGMRARIGVASLTNLKADSG